MDRTLRSKFAEAALRKAVAERVDITDARDDDEAGGKLQLLKALREGTMRTELRFTFAQLDRLSNADLQRVSESLPITLRSLIADFTNCSQLADVAALGAGVEKLQALTSLELDFEGCEQLADVAALGAGLERLQALTSLSLNFEDCSQLADVLQRKFNSRDDFRAALSG